jgi:hypothetical protein
MGAWLLVVGIEVDLVVDKGELVNYGYCLLCCCCVSLWFESSMVTFVTGLAVGALTVTCGLLSCATRHCSGSGCPSRKPASSVLAGDQHTLSTAFICVRCKCDCVIIAIGRSEGGVIIFCLVQHFRALGLVVLGRMVLGVIIGTVCPAAFPANVELALANAVPDPIVPHIHGLGAALLDAVISSNAAGGAIVGDNWGSRLGVAKLVQGDAFGDSLFSAVEESHELGFSDAGDSFA